MENIDIVARDIPLLLSKQSMKKADMTLGFKSDQVVTFGDPTQVIMTKLKHYAVPVNPLKAMLNNVTKRTNAKMNLLTTENNKSKVI